MNENAVESVDHLTESGIKKAEIEIDSTPALHELSASKLHITRSSIQRPVPEPNSAEVWGVKACSDHMVVVKWTDVSGWEAPEIKPYGPLSIMPTASCLHYATQCFEGMKVYRGFDGKLRLFRPDRNCKRLVMSSTRVAMPPFDPVELEKILKAFLAVDGPRWLPKSRPGSFLYLRPTVIGSGEQLGVTGPPEVLLFILAVPWPDFSSPPPGSSGHPAPGLKLLASQNSTRAWPGGFGYAKVGANYGPSFISQIEGRKRGYDQILWLLNNEKEYEVTEAGASNFFVVWMTREGRRELVTAPLDSKIILDGVTRRSVLELARERLLGKGGEPGEGKLPALEVVERVFTMLELEEAQREGRLLEAFLSGTAYFITPVSAISFKDEELAIQMGDDGQSGPYAAALKKWLKDIMYGNVEHPWGVVVEEEEE